jgi:spermidine synthase
MKSLIDWFKKYWSYISPVHLESIQGLENQTLSVYLSNGRYQLSTEHAIYSYDDLYDNFSLAFKKVDWIQLPERAHVLVLGLGLGSVPYMLEKKFSKKFSYTAVEFDESVIFLASKYSIPRLKSSMQIICRDAASHVMEDEDEYDIICIDVFLDDVIPDAISEREFLIRVKCLLSPGGILIFNRLNRERDEKNLIHEYIDQVFSSVFPDYGSIQVEGNCMLFSDKSKLLNT